MGQNAAIDTGSTAAAESPNPGPTGASTAAATEPEHALQPDSAAGLHSAGTPARQRAGRPVPPVQWCSWCKQPSLDPLLVSIIEVGSGPGRCVYACPDCVAAYRIKPIEDHPMDSDGSVQYELAAPDV